MDFWRPIVVAAILALAGIIIGIYGCGEEQPIDTAINCEEQLEILCKTGTSCWKITKEECLDYLQKKEICKFESHSEYERFKRCVKLIDESSCQEIRESSRSGNYSICSEFTDKGGW